MSAFGTMLRVGIQVTLHRAGRVSALPDPNGGSFDAAGDFDATVRLVRSAGHRQPAPIRGRDAGLDGDADLIAEVDEALRGSRPGPKSSGQIRARTAAWECVAIES